MSDMKEIYQKVYEKDYGPDNWSKRTFARFVVDRIDEKGTFEDADFGELILSGGGNGPGAAWGDAVARQIYDGIIWPKLIKEIEDEEFDSELRRYPSTVVGWHEGAEAVIIGQMVWCEIYGLLVGPKGLVIGKPGPFDVCPTVVFTASPDLSKLNEILACLRAKFRIVPHLIVSFLSLNKEIQGEGHLWGIPFAPYLTQEDLDKAAESKKKLLAARKRHEEERKEKDATDS